MEIEQTNQDDYNLYEHYHHTPQGLYDKLVVLGKTINNDNIKGTVLYYCGELTPEQYKVGDEIILPKDSFAKCVPGTEIKLTQE